MNSVDSIKNKAVEPFSLEWNGCIAASANNAAQFALMLALSESKADGYLSISDALRDDAEELQDPALCGLDCYPSVPTSISQQHIDAIAERSQLRLQNNMQTAFFLECAAPSPIHYQDDATKIDEQVLVNCRIATQLKNKPLEHESPHLSMDATLLADIVPAAQAMQC